MTWRALSISPYLKELSPEMVVALVSALVWREQGPDIAELKISDESKEVGTHG